MACACPSQGSTVYHLLKTGSPSYTWTSGCSRMLVERFGLKSDTELGIDEASTGNRDRHTSRARQRLKRVRGQVVCRPSYNDIFTGGNGNNLGVRILGGDDTGGTYTPAAALPSFGWLAATAAKKLEFQDLKVAAAEFSAESGQTLQCNLDLVGKAFATPTVTPQAITLGVTDVDLPMVFHSAALVINSVDYCFSRFRLRIENNIRDLFYNSQTAKCLNEGQLVVSLMLDLPWNAATAADLFGHGDDGLPAVITFAAGDSETVIFSIGSLKWPDRSPEIPDQNEISFPIEGQGFATASNPSIKFTCLP